MKEWKLLGTGNLFPFLISCSNYTATFKHFNISTHQHINASTHQRTCRYFLIFLFSIFFIFRITA